jgi:hypothetical protein
MLVIIANGSVSYYVVNMGFVRYSVGKYDDINDSNEHKYVTNIAVYRRGGIDLSRAFTSVTNESPVFISARNCIGEFIDKYGAITIVGGPQNIHDISYRPLGADVIFDGDGDVKLIEMNIAPGMYWADEYDAWHDAVFYPDMITLVTLALDGKNLPAEMESMSLLRKIGIEKLGPSFKHDTHIPVCMLYSGEWINDFRKESKTYTYAEDESVSEIKSRTDDIHIRLYAKSYYAPIVNADKIDAPLRSDLHGLPYIIRVYAAIISDGNCVAPYMLTHAIMRVIDGAYEESHSASFTHADVKAHRIHVDLNTPQTTGCITHSDIQDMRYIVSSVLARHANGIKYVYMFELDMLKADGVVRLVRGVNVAIRDTAVDHVSPVALMSSSVFKVMYDVIANKSPVAFPHLPRMMSAYMCVKESGDGIYDVLDYLGITVGVIELKHEDNTIYVEIQQKHRRNGYALYAIIYVIREMYPGDWPTHNIHKSKPVISAIVKKSNTAAVGLFNKLGWHAHEGGDTVMYKDVQ